MKKIISVLLCVSILFGMAAVSASANDDIKVIVANDLHLSLKAYAPYTGNTVADPWAHVASSGQLIRESNAIITAFLEKAAASDADYVLLPGDLVDTGSEEEHMLMAAKLAEFENSSGKSVYVVPGNHDFFKTSVDTFVAVYGAFGYDEAVAKADNSASYTADLGADYRLLAIDSTLPGESSSEIDAEDLAWIEAQLESAKADGKKVIAMMHHNLLEHFIFADMIHTTAMVRNEKLKNVLADGGVKFIFTGHTHDNDIISYTSADGNVIYDVVTNSINAYPCQYREAVFAKDVRIETKVIDKVNVALIPAGISEEAIALAGTDFTEYTRKTMWTALRKTFTSYLNAKSLIRLMQLDAEADADMCRIITSLGDKLAEIVEMPFYAADDNADSSVQEIAEKYGKTLPESDYIDLIDLAITLYQAHCVGDENYSVNSTEVNLLINAVSTVLCYCLEDVSAEDYTTVLQFALSFAETEVPDNLLGFAGSTMERIEGIDMIAALVLRPLVAQFTTDDSPADNNVTLTGYRELSGFEKFIQLVRDFFAKVMDFFRMMFSFIPMPA